MAKKMTSAWILKNIQSGHKLEKEKLIKPIPNKEFVKKYQNEKKRGNATARALWAEMWR